MESQLHTARLTPISGQFSFWLQGTVLARSTRVIKLVEIIGERTLPPIMYLPIEDIKKEYLTDSPYTSRCPIKGQAHYWHLSLSGQRWDNLVWYYPDPLPQVETIHGFAAFLPDVVSMECD